MVTTQPAAPTAPAPLLTAAELLALPDDDYRYELVRGKLIRMPPPGSCHGRTVARVTIRLGHFIETHNLGTILNESGYHLEWGPDTVRAPDVSFISAERLPPDEFPHGYPTLAPDLAVEVLSPSERPGARREKMQDYFAAGTRLVWEIDPGQRTITVYRSVHDGTTLAAAAELTGAEVLPGFVCRVAELIP
jgi:Uma2 family endonuclease